MTETRWTLSKAPELVHPHQEHERELGPLHLEANPYRWRVLRGGVEIAGALVEDHHVLRLSRKRQRHVTGLQLAQELADARAGEILAAEVVGEGPPRV